MSIIDEKLDITKLLKDTKSNVMIEYESNKKLHDSKYNPWYKERERAILVLSIVCISYDKYLDRDVNTLKWSVILDSIEFLILHGIIPKNTDIFRYFIQSKYIDSNLEPIR